MTSLGFALVALLVLFAFWLGTQCRPKYPPSPQGKDTGEHRQPPVLPESSPGPDATKEKAEPQIDTVDKPLLPNSPHELTEQTAPPVTRPNLKQERKQTAPVFVITDEFENVKKALLDRVPMIFVHGGAGVGKSTLINWLYQEKLIDIKLAPTGLAALNIGGMTLHKFFGLPPVDVFPKNPNNAPKAQVPQASHNVLEHTKTICIDEVSMVRADLIDTIDLLLKKIANPGEPFGGYQMLFVGDLYQLPPIVKKNDPTIYSLFHANDPGTAKLGWASPFFLDAVVFSELKPLRIDLTKVFRQHDQSFINLLNDVRVCRNLQSRLQEINQAARFGPPDKKVTLVLRNNTAQRVNDEQLRKISTRPILFHAQALGAFAGRDQKDLPAPPKITLKKGAFVMVLFNDTDGSFVNGTTGIIRNLTADFADVDLKNGRSSRISWHTWESYRLEWSEEEGRFVNVKDGSYTQMPLIPAYAITCHKAQGKTLDNAYLDFEGNAFAAGQAYVALSRTRTFTGLSLSRPLTLGDFPRDERLQYFEEKGWI